MKGNWSIVRQVFQRRFSNLRAFSPTSRSSSLSSSVRPLILVPRSMSSLIPRNSVFPASNIGSSVEFKFSNTSFPHRRSFCSAEGGENGIVIVKTKEEFISAMSKAQDGSLPSIFYFTAEWSRCRFISNEIVELTSGRFPSPVIEELSKQYPDVTTYKIDIDKVGFIDTIMKLNITAKPTLHFFKGGTKKGEVVGADVTKLKDLMEQLYK